MSYKQNNITTALAFGYTEEEFSSLIDKAFDIYYDFMISDRYVTKKDVFDRIKEISTSMEDVFIVTWCIGDICNDEEFEMEREERFENA